MVYDTLSILFFQLVKLIIAFSLLYCMMNKKYLTEVVLLTKSYNLQDFKDWMHWHLDIIGFDCAHIFDNESSVDIKSVCDDIENKYRDLYPEYQQILDKAFAVKE